MWWGVFSNVWVVRYVSEYLRSVLVCVATLLTMLQVCYEVLKCVRMCYDVARVRLGEEVLRRFYFLVV